MSKAVKNEFTEKAVEIANKIKSNGFDAKTEKEIVDLLAAAMEAMFDRGYNEGHCAGEIAGASATRASYGGGYQGNNDFDMGGGFNTTGWI